MSEKYLIDKTTKTLIFTGKPKSVNKDNVEKNDKERFASAVIPNSVETIAGDSFNDCTTLASLHIPNSVAKIYAGAFRNCRSLAFVHIPNSVSNIDDCAFFCCHALASVYIPRSTATIGNSSFENCPSLHKACITDDSKINTGWLATFSPQISLLRPCLKPITSLQKKSACRATKTSYSTYL